MAVALPKPLNAGVFCYTEKSSLCIFLLPFLFIFLSLSSYLSSLSYSPHASCFFPSASSTSTHLRTHKAQKTVAWASSIQRWSHFLLTHPSEARIIQILRISHGLWDAIIKRLARCFYDWQARGWTLGSWQPISGLLLVKISLGESFITVACGVDS